MLTSITGAKVMRRIHETVEANGAHGVSPSEARLMIRDGSAIELRALGEATDIIEERTDVVSSRRQAAIEGLKRALGLSDKDLEEGEDDGDEDD